MAGAHRHVARCILALLHSQTWRFAGAVPDASAAAAAGPGAQATGASTPSSTAPPLAFYPDVEPSSCRLGYNCSADASKGMPNIYRGICVQATNPGSGNACWDVCNPNHLPRAYNVSDRKGNDEMLNAGIRSMIQSVRAGLNPIVRCPAGFGGDTCPPGDECSAEYHTRYSIPEGRGMCVLDENQPSDRSCVDMCDSTRSPEEYTMGTPAGTGAKVMAMRASSACPGIQVWQVVLIIVFILLIAICLVGVAYVARHKFPKKSSSKTEGQQRRLEAEPRDYQEDFPEMQDGPMMDSGMNAGAYQDDMHQDMMPPPSPPRQHHSRDVLVEENTYGPPPEEQPRGYYAEPPSQSHAGVPEPPPPPHHPQHQQQQMQMQAPLLDQPPQEPLQVHEPPFYPGGMPGEPPPSSTQPGAPGMRIPGLDEPNLLGNLGHMMHQGGVVPDAYHTQVPQSPYMAGVVPSNTQPGGVGAHNSFNFAPGQQAALQQPILTSFHTQLPSVYNPGSSNPGSVQLRPPGSQQWFR